MFPAHWTNLDKSDKQAPDEQSSSQLETIGTTSDLLHTRTIVDALLRREDSLASEQQEERGRANELELYGSTRADPTGVGGAKR